jgi:membrane associated rhomboid family serine protease
VSNLDKKSKVSLLIENAEVAFYAVAVIVGVWLINSVLPVVDLRAYGIRPREAAGIFGILLCPLLHADLNHVLANSTTLFVLLTLSLSYSRRLTLIAVTAIILLGGGAVWALGQSGVVYIGASGVVFGLIGFLLTVGIFRREWGAIIVSTVVLIFYAGTLRMLFLLHPGISWAAHFWGMFFGVAVAWLTRYSQPGRY